MKVAILRSSRFPPATIEACRARWPAADLRVIDQPGSEHEWRGRRVPDGDAWAYDEARVFRPWPFVRSRAGRALRRWHPDVIVIQWNNQDGRAHGWLGLTALTVRPAGFVVYRRDDSWIMCGPIAWAAGFRVRALRACVMPPVCRAWQGTKDHVPGLLLATTVAVATLCATPMWLVSRARERCRVTFAALAR